MIISLHRMMPALLLMLSLSNADAQNKQLTIEECYQLARQNYPLVKKHSLIERSSRYSLNNASRLYLPQVTVNGQATYQSETISFPDALSNVPGISLPEISKDQYKLQAEVSQQIYDGGNTRNQKDLIHANEQIQQQSLEVNLNTLKDRVNQVYFSVLLMDEQLKQNEIRKSDLQSALDKATVAYRNGTAFKSNIDELKAELINIDMTAIEFSANRKAYRNMLSLLIGQPVEETTQLSMPLPSAMTTEINRPELKLFDIQKKTFDIREKQIKSEYLPRVNAFVQGAYSRPTLNIIENKFGPWWMGGLRLNWSLGSLYTQKNDRNIISINRQSLDVDKETFLFNTKMELSRQNEEVEKYASLIQKDDAIISLRTSVVQSARAQLDNGVITVHEYISKLNEENLAKQARIVHNIQLLQAQFNYKNTSGN